MRAQRARAHGCALPVQSTNQRACDCARGWRHFKGHCSSLPQPLPISRLWAPLPQHAQSASWLFPGLVGASFGRPRLPPGSSKPHPPAILPPLTACHPAFSPSPSPSLAALDAHRGLLRWHIHYNLLVLRMISFAADLHWKRLGRPPRTRLPADTQPRPDLDLRVRTGLAIDFQTVSPQVLRPPLRGGDWNKGRKGPVKAPAAPLTAA